MAGPARGRQVDLLLGLQRQAGNQTVVAVVQRAWLDEQVEFVAGPLRASDEGGAVRQLNGYSFDDIRRIVGKLPADRRKQLKAALGAFVGKYDVERIRTCIAVVEGGGPPQLAAATERVHHLVRGQMWADAYKFLFSDTGELIRTRVLQRLSSGHLKVLLEKLTREFVPDAAGRETIRREMAREARRRPGFKVSDGNDFSGEQDLLGSNMPAKAPANGGPTGNVGALLIEGADDAKYRLSIHTHHDDGMDVVGHAWIEIQEVGWPMRGFSWGFWPNARGGVRGMVAGARGQLMSPDLHSGQGITVRTRDGTRAQIRLFQALVDAYAGKDYTLFGDNCATFATDAWKAMTGEALAKDDWFFSSPSDVADKRD